MKKAPVLIILAIFAVSLFAADQAMAKSKINKSFWGGVAIEGYDPVAYFTQGRPVEGSSDYEFEWMDATWRFASQEALEMFKAAPEKYAPQYGGYCAYAVAMGGTAGIDPDAWKIVDGKLYLNYDQEIQEKWLKNMEEFIRQADANWPGVVE